MNQITYPLNRESTGTGVTDLQDALLLFLQNGIFMLNDEDLRFYLDTLRVEQAGRAHSRSMSLTQMGNIFLLADPPSQETRVS